MNQPEINLRYIPCAQTVAAPPTSADVTRLKHKIVATRRGILRPLVMPATRELARLLIVWDALRNRTEDAYVSYTITSRSFSKAESTGYLLCPNCRKDLGGVPECVACGIKYDRICDMLFLLPKDLAHVQSNFNPADEGYHGGSE